MQQVPQARPLWIGLPQHNRQTTPVREASTNHSRRNDQIQSAGSSHCFGNGQHHRQGTRRSSRHLPDTGAELDAIPPVLFHRCFESVRLRAEDNPVTAVGSAIQNDGSFSATLDWGADDGTSHPVAVTVHVLRDLKQLVLSRFTQRKLGMLPADYPHTRVNQIDAQQPVTNAAGEGPVPRTDDSSLFPNLMARTLPAPEAISSINIEPISREKERRLAKLGHRVSGHLR